MGKRQIRDNWGLLRKATKDKFTSSLTRQQYLASCRNWSFYNLKILFQTIKSGLSKLVGNEVYNEDLRDDINNLHNKCKDIINQTWQEKSKEVKSMKFADGSDKVDISSDPKTLPDSDLNF